MIRAEHLAYFKDLFEGRAEISWNAWFKRNESQLAQELPRMEYLRLKFDKMDEAEKLLRKAGIQFEISPLAKRERHYSLLHDSVLDEKGRPLAEFQRKAYDGAIGCFMDGSSEKGTEILAKFVRKAMRRPLLKRADAIGDLCFDGEMQLATGDPAIGTAILELIAELDTGDDLLDPAIRRARELLQRSKQ